MRTVLFISFLTTLFLGCRSQAKIGKEDTVSVNQSSVNPDDCKIKAQVFVIDAASRSMDLQISEVLEVGFGFQSSLHKGQRLTVYYAKKLDEKEAILNSEAEFIGVLTSEPSFGDDKVTLTLVNIE